MAIHLNRDENARYTVWRALNPDGMLHEMMAWIRAEWQAFFAAHGLPKNEPVAAHQAEFNAWLFARHGATWEA
jgi:hypothetical protein